MQGLKLESGIPGNVQKWISSNKKLERKILKKEEDIGLEGVFLMDSWAIGIFAFKNYSTLAISDVHRNQTVNKLMEVRTGISGI